MRWCLLIVALTLASCNSGPDGPPAQAHEQATASDPGPFAACPAAAAESLLAGHGEVSPDTIDTDIVLATFQPAPAAETPRPRPIPLPTAPPAPASPDKPAVAPVAATPPATAPAATTPAAATRPSAAATTLPSVAAPSVAAATIQPWRLPSGAKTRAQLRAGKKPKPDYAVAKTGCVTADCHPAVKQYKVLHGPVNVNACDACHKLADAKKHTYTLIRGKTTICTFCHKMKTLSGPVVHKPVKMGECLPCHDPHGGPSKLFLRGSTTAQMCASCHKRSVIAGKKSVHGPVAAGACGACHKGHSAPRKNLLVAEGRDLCLGCHADMKKQLARTKYPHKAMAKDCRQCHDAHASDYPKITKAPPLKLCTTSCHQKIKEVALDAKYKHSAMTQDRACLSCHTAHGGDLAKLMRSKPITACMKCHSKKIVVDKDTTVAALTEILDPKTNKHGPIRKGDCGGCHAVHGSNIEHLLNHPNPPTFYAAFSTEAYGLCFACHNKELALERETSTVTGFRDGTRNLHYLHVNKPRNGRSCRACHSTHASTNPMHVCESVPFGNWKLPVNFTPTKTGGSCAAGCHQKLAYDRETPVNAAEAGGAPTSRPSPPASGGSTTQPASPPTGIKRPPPPSGIRRPPPTTAPAGIRRPPPPSGIRRPPPVEGPTTPRPPSATPKRPPAELP